MSKGEGIKEINEFPRRLKIFFWVIVALLIIGTLGFMALSKSNAQNSFYRTAETLAFMFHEDSSVSERFLEIFLAIVGVFLVWWVLWSIADMLLDGNLKKYLKMRFYSFKIKRMNKHIIIIGGGRVGEEIADIISKKKTPFLIVESDPKVVALLKKKKYTVIEGDASNEDVLKQAGIERASKLIASLPKTETNIVITLTAKDLNPKIEVYSRSENPSLVTKLKRAGAKVVIVPEIIAADKFAGDLSL